MFLTGIIILLLTFIAIIRRFETRMVLFTSGVVMAAAGGQLSEAVNAFVQTMVHSTLVPTICTVMGFAYVMKYTKCDAHMVHLLAGSMKKMRPLLIPGTVVLTYFINIALPSAAGCAAAVGAIMIPTMMAAGVHPAIAASAVMAGTIGGTLSPGSAHVPFIGKLANMDPMSVVAGHMTASIVGAAIGAVSLYVVAYFRGEQQGYAGAIVEGEIFKINYLRAFVPIFPLLLLLLGSKQLALLPLIDVPQAMIIGTIVGLIVVRCNPQELTKSFFNGMGQAYGSIIGLIVSAAVFTKGMDIIGLTSSLTELMKESDQIAAAAASFGPMIIAVLCGSGDAATLAFNGSITPHALDFGFSISNMGSAAFLSGTFGRTMSPVAGAAIVCAQMAHIDPLEISKRNAPGMILAAIASMFIMLF